MRLRVALVALAAIGLGVIAFIDRPGPATSMPRLSWVATAHQFGPVGYRDPAGGISPDGAWIAYSEGRFLRVKPIDGGPIVDLPAGPAQIRYLAWRPDSQAVA